MLMRSQMIAVMCVVIPLQLPFLAGEEEAEKKKKKGIEDTSRLGKSEGSANKIVGDAVMGIRTVASFNLEKRFYESFATSTAQVSSIQKGDALKGGFFMGLSDFVMFSSMGVVFYYSIYLANLGLVDFEKVSTTMTHGSPPARCTSKPDVHVQMRSCLPGKRHSLRLCTLFSLHAHTPRTRHTLFSLPAVHSCGA